MRETSRLLAQIARMWVRCTMCAARVEQADLCFHACDSMVQPSGNLVSGAVNMARSKREPTKPSENTPVSLLRLHIVII